VGAGAGHTDGDATGAASPFRITAEPLEVASLIDAVSGAAAGAVTVFVGTVRNHNAGRSVRWLEYEAHEGLAVKAFERIGREGTERWPSLRLAIAHRIGRLEIGEASVVIAAASPHRAEAFSGCRYAIERIKQIAPIWKHEHFEGGEAWIEGATADPDDPAAREEALARACA
jgi:molybdopterin synthase catalytic subunit